MNIMNEWYIRDCSRKITSVLRARGMSGKHTSNHCIYGYKKDPNDKDHWIIDEEAAEVVRRIYRMAIEGKGPYEIARILATERLSAPLTILHSAVWETINQTTMPQTPTHGAAVQLPTYSPSRNIWGIR